MRTNVILTGITECPITIKKMYAVVPIPHPCDEIVTELCGCVYHGFKHLSTCDGCLQRRLGP